MKPAERSAEDEAHARAVFGLVLEEFLKVPPDKHGCVELYFHEGRVTKWAVKVFTRVKDVLPARPTPGSARRPRTLRGEAGE